MKPILIVLIIVQIYGAFCTKISPPGQHGFMDISNPTVQGFKTSIATLSNAITNAIYNVTSWIDSEHDVVIDTRLNLLNELKLFQVGFQQIIFEINQNFLNDTITTTEFDQLLLKLNIFLNIHLNNINHMITILIPTMQDMRATHAITSCLHAVQVIEDIIQKIQSLISS